MPAWDTSIRQPALPEPLYFTEAVKSIVPPTPKLDAAGVSDSATLDASPIGDAAFLLLGRRRHLLAGDRVNIGMVDFAVDSDDALRQRIQAEYDEAQHQHRRDTENDAAAAIHRLLLFRTFLTGPRGGLVSHGSQSSVSSSVRHRGRTHHACRVRYTAAAPLPRAGFRSDRPRQATRCICPAARGLSTARSTLLRSSTVSPSGRPRSAFSTSPRTCRSVPWNRWRGRVRRCPNPGLPLRRNAHFPAIGQASHNGDFAVHTVAPSSMTAWFHTTDGRSKRRHFAESSSGSSRFASARSAGLALPPSDSTPDERT